MEDTKLRFDILMDRKHHGGRRVRSWRPPTKDERLEAFMDYPAIRELVAAASKMGRDENLKEDTALKLSLLFNMIDLVRDYFANDEVVDEMKMQTVVEFCCYVIGGTDPITQDLKGIFIKEIMREDPINQVFKEF